MSKEDVVLLVSLVKDILDCGREKGPRQGMRSVVDRCKDRLENGGTVLAEKVFVDLAGDKAKKASLGCPSLGGSKRLFILLVHSYRLNGVF